MAASLIAGLAAARGAANVKLKEMEIFRIPVNRRGDWLLVRIRTDQGITGIGDASHGSDENTIVYLRQLFEQMQGRGFTDIEFLRRLGEPLGRKPAFSGACALSAIEQAMWDIAGQVAGLPVYDLFGGKLQGSIRNYANINRATFDRTPEGFAKWAAHAVGDGFDAIKLAPFDGWPRESVEAHIQLGIACTKAVRDAIGPSRDLLIDAHSNFSLERGLRLAAEMEPLNLFWLEEVCPGIPQLAQINNAAKMPTAGGESIFGTRDYLPYIAGKAVDVIMPDIKYCGGLLETKKIAAMGEAAGLKVAPHGPASPVGNIAAAHVCATLPNFLILELGYGEVDWRAEVLEPAETLRNGRITLSERPGFGCRLNDKLLAAKATKV